MLTDFVSGNSNTYTKNPDYWDKEKIGGQEYKLPFVDKIIYRTIKDEATCVTALRTGKLDILEAIRWQNVELAEEERAAAQVEPLARTSPAPSWRCASTSTARSRTSACAARSTWRSTRRRSSRPTTTATPSCSPIRSIPTTSATSSRWTSMPASVQELFKYDPAKAKKLWPKQGIPKGFTTKVQVCSCNPDHMDLLPLVAAYLEQVGVKLEIQPMEYGAFLSAHDARARIRRPTS